MPDWYGAWYQVVMSKEDDVTRQIRRIHTLLAEGRVNKHQLAVKAGIRPSSLTGLEKPDWNPLASTLAKLIQALDELVDETPKRVKKKQVDSACEAA